MLTHITAKYMDGNGGGRAHIFDDMTDAQNLASREDTNVLIQDILQTL